MESTGDGRSQSVPHWRMVKSLIFDFVVYPILLWKVFKNIVSHGQCLITIFISLFWFVFAVAFTTRRNSATQSCLLASMKASSSGTKSVCIPAALCWRSDQQIIPTWDNPMVVGATLETIDSVYNLLRKASAIRCVRHDFTATPKQCSNTKTRSHKVRKILNGFVFNLKLSCLTTKPI